MSQNVIEAARGDKPFESLWQQNGPWGQVIME
jgi:hypothetical protein